ncbi:hypothetical protein [Exiguobacterium sp. PHA03]|uniref:hypothetical protein n=1 Tax=Exiguobacterium sp. PHA03 TaxID=3064895 RepID=UPI0035C090FA
MKTTFTKVAVATVLAGTTLFGGVASAATKEEKKVTDRYTALKAGMTIEQVAKVIYGKDYKKQITTKGGSTVFKIDPDMSTTNQGYKTKMYRFLNEKTDMDVTGLIFMTKKKSSVYLLTQKTLTIFKESGYRESKMKLVKGKKIKTDMTEKQLDAILTGDGLGEWTSVTSVDWTPIQDKKEIEMGFAIKSLMKTYVFPTSTKELKYVNMNYDYDKKTYIVANQSSL